MLTAAQLCNDASSSIITEIWQQSVLHFFQHYFFSSYYFFSQSLSCLIVKITSHMVMCLFSSCSNKTQGAKWKKRIRSPFLTSSFPHNFCTVWNKFDHIKYCLILLTHLSGLCHLSLRAMMGTRQRVQPGVSAPDSY